MKLCKKLSGLFLIGFVALQMAACSSDGQQEGQQMQEAVQGDEYIEENAANEQYDEQLEENYQESEENFTEAEGNIENPLANENLGGENVEIPANAMNPGMINPAPEAPVMGSTNFGTTGTAGRVVRFVTADGTAVYAQPSPGSTISTLNRGDVVVVSLSAGWGQISEGRFVSESSLSTQGVPRTKSNNPNAWK